jgi:small subunit ribosomal protein S20
VANIKSAKKRISVIRVKTARNRRIKSRLKDTFKALDVAIATEDKDAAKQLLAKAEKKLMQAAAKGTIHKNAASRKVSRLTHRFNTVFAEKS